MISLSPGVWEDKYFKTVVVVTCRYVKLASVTVNYRGGGGISTENKLLKMKLLLRYSATYRDGNG